jgi:CheY-like chemotaxis protein/two-component sensor histidine kinase
VVRAEVERVSLLKDEFLATLSHELRTPLNAVLGWSKILLSRIKEDSDTRRGLETIARNAGAQAQLIDDLLDMNRIVSGRIRLDVQRLDLASVVEAALESARPSAEAKSIEIRKTIDPNAGPVRGDPNRLQQVVWNLLTNAVKFTPRGGSIDVILQRIGSHVEIVVQDTGMGISAAFLPQLFERFRQADSSSTRRFGGLGLGLSIAKQLVELHGGTVTAHSEGDGKGSTFCVRLPLRAVREEPDSQREHPTSGRGTAPVDAQVSLAGIAVLVVDDEADARSVVGAVLSDAGATVLTAASADEALAVVRSRRFDVLISDIGMPDRDGYQLIRDVRQLGAAEGGRTPAVALTAFARSEDRTRAMLAGYQVHMTKPVEPQELVATIRSVAGHAGREP